MRSNLIFDLETTGLPPKTRYGDTVSANQPDKYSNCRVVQICWIIDNVSKPSESFERSFIVKPNGFTIPSESTDIHGISHDRAISEGTDLIEVLRSLYNDLVLYPPKRVVCHNLAFDTTVLASELYRLKLLPRSDHNDLISHLLDVMENSQAVCTMKIGRDICKLPFPNSANRTRNTADCWKNPTLTELYKYLSGKDLEGAHDATVDTRCCAECYKLLKELTKKT